MEACIFIVTVIVALVAFDLLAVRYGVDSRGTVGDDRARSLTIGDWTGGLIR